MSIVRVTPEPLTAAAFAPFGSVLEDAAGESVAINAARFDRFAKLCHVDIGGAGSFVNVSIMRCRVASELPLAVPLLERHPLGSQAFMPLQSEPFFVLVAPPGDAPDLAAAKAFVSNGRQGVNLNRSVLAHATDRDVDRATFLCRRLWQRDELRRSLRRRPRPRAAGRGAMSTTAVLGRIAHCLTRPGADGHGVEYFDDGALLIADGIVRACGPAKSLLPAEGSLEIIDHRGQLILPGFVDCHIHYPQTDIIASFGKQLLTWLETYTFPAEARFADLAVATDTAEFFVNELLRNGTTTALVFATVHPGSVDALFTAAARRNMRIAAGKVLMDRHCPENLRDTAASAYTDSRALIERWHGNGRAVYAITPRFAVTSTPQQLDAAARLHREFPDTLVHTHLAENHDEIAWIAELFPEARSYLDVYVRHALAGPNSVFAHGIHLDSRDREVLAEAGSALAFCPTSNLFLGSGLFDRAAAVDAGIAVGLGTDVGGGTSFSLMRTLAEAYKVLQLQRQTLDSLSALHLATLGGAEALSMEAAIGNFRPGKEADFIVLDAAATPLIERRLARTASLDEELFVQWMLGDDRSVAATYVAGQHVHSGASD